MGAVKEEIIARLQRLTTARTLRQLSAVQLDRGHPEPADRMLKRAREIEAEERRKSWAIR